MKVESTLSEKIKNGDFIVTAEFVPWASGDENGLRSALDAFPKGLTAVNVADNCRGIGTSSIAMSFALLRAGVEPICQMVTRDRNRIAIQSDLLGASLLGIKNMLCLSGYHQALLTSPESANVYDIDSIQLLEIATNMAEKNVLQDGGKIEGQFSMLLGAVANPFLAPIELNIMRMEKKIGSGAKFIQTAAVFDTDTFGKWIEAVSSLGLKDSKGPAILAGVLALDSASEAERLRNTYADYCIQDSIVERLKKSGDEEAQKKEGIAICIETIKKLKSMKGIRGIHVHSGLDGQVSPEVVEAALS